MFTVSDLSESSLSQVLALAQSRAVVGDQDQLGLALPPKGMGESPAFFKKKYVSEKIFACKSCNMLMNSIPLSLCQGVSH